MNMLVFFSRRIWLAVLFLSPYVVVSAAGGRIHIVPEPVSVVERPGSFILRQGATLAVEGDSLSGISAWFVAQVKEQTGISLREEKAGRGAIFVHVGKDKEAGREGYSLTVSSSGIHINASAPAGAFYGMQTFLQLLPPGRADFMSVPCVEIADSPRFAWRGLMLDVSRHFFTKQEVMKYIDEMVRYKYNTLHLHLSDDQGWRIEIKSLPQLTEHGAWRVQRTGRWGEFLPPLSDEPVTDGGFYTQDDMREIIRYAQERFVTILPEIDVPAHSLALISSYPNLSCTQLPYPVNPGARPPVRQDNALCIGNDSVYLVLDKIFTELAALFPCPYIHVGGDEAYKGFWATCPKCQK